MATALQSLKTPRPRSVYYPTGDGKPMAETDKHRDQGIYGIEALKVRFADRPDVYVSGNNFLFWEEGSPRKKVSPDVYVVFGVGVRQRDSYKAWEEGGKLPDVVFEITSKSTQQEDVEKKRPLYRDVLKVPEYVQFDPTGDYLDPRLQGHRLENGVYVPIPLEQGDRLYSVQLGLYVVMLGQTFRFYDPLRQEFLRTPEEQAQRAEQEARRAEQEARRAQALEQQVEAEAQARAEADLRAEMAEADNARLRAEIEALRRQNER